MPKPERSSKYDAYEWTPRHLNLKNLELFKKGVEDAVGNGGGDEGYRNISGYTSSSFYKEGYEFGMGLWSQHIGDGGLGY